MNIQTLLAPSRSAMSINSLLRKYAVEDLSLVNVNYTIQKIDRAQRLVTGQVYAPNSLDSHGHFMTAKELTKVAHNFLLEGMQNQIDVMHDNEVIDACIVESWIARKHPDWEEGAWVATTKINDDDKWQDVLDGKINGYSFEILTFRNDVEVEIEFAAWYYGFTDPDPDDKHVHAYLIKMGKNGEVLKGWTSAADDGHMHIIKRANVTEKSDGRLHRIHLEF